MARYCISCGEEIIDGRIFCGGCGAKNELPAENWQPAPVPPSMQTAGRNL